jgi:Zn-dependent metalloprotease
MPWILALGLVSTATSAAVGSSPINPPPVSYTSSSVIKVASVLSTPESAPEAKSAEAAAQAFIAIHSQQWGVTAQTVRLTKTLAGVDGLFTLRFVQTLSDLDVLGTVLALTLDAQHRLVSFNVTTLKSERPMSQTTQLSQEQAVVALQGVISASGRVLATQVLVTNLHPVVADSALVSGIPDGRHVAWSSWTTITGHPDSVAVSVLDDATSALLYSLRIAHHITYKPNVCDLQNAVVSDYSAQSTALGSTSLVRKAGDYTYINALGDVYPLCGYNYSGVNTPSSETALANIGATWSFYKDVLGVDINAEKWLGNISASINGDRKPRISAFTNVCFLDSKADCPSYGNAFWVPWSAPTAICRTGACSGIFMGAGFDQALDVIAHELTHGLTFSIAFQDGFTDTSDAAAMSEGLSDVFGEAAERLSPNSQADPSWQMGENVKGVDPGPYRVMQTGTTFSPDSPTTSKPAITKDWKSADGHVNNGPLNRFAWLVANGETVGSTTVQPLGTVPSDGICHTLNQCTGISRMATLMYQTLPSLTSASSYFEFGQAVMDTCQTLVNTSVAGFNEAACTNVGRALRLTGITKFTITDLTSSTSVPKYSYLPLVASVKSYAGATITLQPMKLEQLVKGKWTTVRQADSLCKRYCTNAQGRVTFNVKWSKSGRYRISANSNFGAMRAQTAPAYIRAY